MQSVFECGQYQFPIGKGQRPLVMGILNVTPDSFSDGGKHIDLESALSRAEQMIEEGVDIIDIGGESTRPGAMRLSLEDELRRVLPVLFALRDCGKPLSIDTYKPQVMREALAAGANMVNDINGFREAGALAAIRDSDCGICIMHMQSIPETMQHQPVYRDVLQEVTTFLQDQIQKFDAAGIARSRICIDPGFGFGKSLTHNLTLLRNIGALVAALDLPVLAGLSRKSMIGEITGKPVAGRLAGSVAAALIAADNGASILRVHDVAETVDALRVWQATTEQ